MSHAQQSNLPNQLMQIVQGFKNILVLTDFSPAAWEALKYGVLLHECVKANITLLHVVPAKITPQATKAPLAVGVLQEKIQLLQREMNLNSNTKTVVLNGNVAEEILEHLKDVHYDLIVMGLNGNGGLNSVLGKNTRSVLESSGIPVMVLPSKTDQSIMPEA